MARTRILVVDDSVVARKLISDIIEEEADFTVVGTAAHGRIALAKIPRLSPDLITLDVNMPEMDGMETLKAVRSEYPDIPVIMVSNLTERGAATTVDALFLGASDYVTKATKSKTPEHARLYLKQQLVPKIRVLHPHGKAAPPRLELTKARPLGKPQRRAISRRSARIEVVAIGASTGGPNALATLMEAIPDGFPVPVLIVQHMPENFTKFLAKRLDGKSTLRVDEVCSGQQLVRGDAWLAPGNRHIEVGAVGDKVVVRTHEGPLVNSCRPAVDILFASVAACYGASTLAVILTGMGQDGFRGCELINEAGGQIIAQDEATSVVWGMPGYVVEGNLADCILPIDRIGDEIVRRVMGSR